MVQKAVEDVHELGKGIQFYYATGMGTQRRELIAHRGEPEKAHQGNFYHMFQIAEFNLEHREGEHQPPNEGNIKAKD